MYSCTGIQYKRCCIRGVTFYSWWFYVLCFVRLFFRRRSPISVAAAAIYMASQASDEKRSQKGLDNFTVAAFSLLNGFHCSKAVSNSRERSACFLALLNLPSPMQVRLVTFYAASFTKQIVHSLGMHFVPFLLTIVANSNYGCFARKPVRPTETRPKLKTIRPMIPINDTNKLRTRNVNVAY